MSGKAQKTIGRKLWFPGFLLVLFCLCGAACGVLLSIAFDTRNEEPIGTIVMSGNVVQRRTANRKIWDRLTVGSPLYARDTIRTADSSKSVCSHTDSTTYMTIVDGQAFDGNLTGVTLSRRTQVAANAIPSTMRISYSD